MFLISIPLTDYNLLTICFYFTKVIKSTRLDLRVPSRLLEKVKREEDSRY